jgi:hypothetical protein
MRRYYLWKILSFLYSILQSLQKISWRRIPLELDSQWENIRRPFQEQRKTTHKKELNKGLSTNLINEKGKLAH